jgi:hypothetical protein
MTYDVTKYTDRLSALKFFPTRSHAVAAVADTLLAVCASESEADRLVAIALERFDDWPGPASLRRLHYEAIASHRPQQALPEGCGLCRHTGGWRPVFTLIERIRGGPERKQTFRPDANPEEFRRKLYAQYAKSPDVSLYDAVAPCSCEMGRIRQEQCRKADAQGQGQ